LAEAYNSALLNQQELFAMRRRLTKAELVHAHDIRCAHEQSNFPEHMIDVIILPETDDDGRAQALITIKRECVL
jgi:hypothetical protein